MTARALVDGGPAARGGPWAHPWLSKSGHKAAAEVRRLAARAASGAAARSAVLEFSAQQPEDTYLRCHCEDRDFNQDNAPFGRKRAKSWKRWPSGCMKRILGPRGVRTRLEIPVWAINMSFPNMVSSDMLCFLGILFSRAQSVSLDMFSFFACLHFRAPRGGPQCSAHPPWPEETGRVNTRFTSIQ